MAVLESALYVLNLETASFATTIKNVTLVTEPEYRIIKSRNNPAILTNKRDITLLDRITDVFGDEPIPQYATLNEHGLWCDFCGENVEAAHNMVEDYIPPENCPNCGAPDEIDFEKI